MNAGTVVIEENITAPRADAILHILGLHAATYHGRGNTASRIQTMTAVALMEDYAADEIPHRYLEAFESALDLTIAARGYRVQQTQLCRDVAPSMRRTLDSRHLADLAGQAHAEARHIIRHKITLEGNDL